MNSNKVKEKEEEKIGVFASCSFVDLGLHPSLCQHLQDKMGFQTPTQIQAQAIPAVISGKDVLVNAATGTGKTIVYLAPIMHLLQMENPRIQRRDGTFALVLVPTRELCMQVYEILQKLAHRFHWIVPGYIMGGENRGKEKARLRRGISILIATPGRLLDHLKHTSSFIYSNLRWIVFDEADRRDVLSNKEDTGKNKRPCNISRQNILLSATLNEKVNHLANISLNNPITIDHEEKKISVQQLKPSIKKLSALDSEEDEEAECIKTLPFPSENYNLPAQLIQRYAKVPCGSRLVVLLSILKNLFEREASQKIVVFLSTCDGVDFHYSLLNEFKWSPSLQSDTNNKQAYMKCKTFRLHGNMDHENRRTTFQGFKSEKSALLLCTDVAARGLDFPKVRCIIQYDSPGEASEYVHRVGRTARLGEKGEALLFLQPIEIDYLHDLQKHGVLLKEYPLEKIVNSFPLYGQGKNYKNLVSLDMHPWVMSLQRALESFIANEPKLKQIAKDAFCKWVRSYTAHRGHLKKYFVVKKLHLGHVARSFGLKDQPSLVGGSFQVQAKKRKRDQRNTKSSNTKKKGRY